MPKRWTNLTRPNSTKVYNSKSWKALSRSEQQQFIDDGRPKPHEHLHLCHANYPPELKMSTFYCHQVFCFRSGTTFAKSENGSICTITRRRHVRSGWFFERHVSEESVHYTVACTGKNRQISRNTTACRPLRLCYPGSQIDKFLAKWRIQLDRASTKDHISLFHVVLLAQIRVDVTFENEIKTTKVTQLYVHITNSAGSSL